MRSAAKAHQHRRRDVGDASCAVIGPGVCIGAQSGWKQLGVEGAEQRGNRGRAEHAERERPRQENSTLKRVGDGAPHARERTACPGDPRAAQREIRSSSRQREPAPRRRERRRGPQREQARGRRRPAPAAGSRPSRAGARAPGQRQVRRRECACAGRSRNRRENLSPNEIVVAAGTLTLVKLSWAELEGCRSASPQGRVGLILPGSRRSRGWRCSRPTRCCRAPRWGCRRTVSRLSVMSPVVRESTAGSKSITMS